MRDYQSEINVREREIIEKRNFLNDTDYKLLRQLDGGDPMDDATKEQRRLARARINQLEIEISAIQTEWDDEQEEMGMMEEMADEQE